MGIALIVLAAVLGVIVTGSTTTTTADRSLSVAVADDTEAYVAVEDCAVRNNHQTTVSVDITHNGTTETVRLAPGEQYTIDSSGTVDLHVTGNGGAIETQLSYESSCVDA